MSELPPPPPPPRAVAGRDAALRSFGRPNSVTRQFDFLDDRYEGRRLFAEVLGTFFLVLVAAGGGIVNARFGPGAVPAAARSVAPGLMVMAVILFMGTVSGAHLNPAVSVAFALRGNFPWRRVPAYVAAQAVGAVLAAALLRALIGGHGSAGLTLPGPGISPWVALVWEMTLTTGLISVILGTASGAQQIGPFAAIGVGGYIALAGLWGAPVSGASMNPARSFGPALVAGQWHALARPGPGPRRLEGLVGLPGRAAGRGGHRRRLCLGAARAGRRRSRHAGRAGHPGLHLAAGPHRRSASRAGPSARSPGAGRPHLR